MTKLTIEEIDHIIDALKTARASSNLADKILEQLTQEVRKKVGPSPPDIEKDLNRMKRDRAVNSKVESETDILITAKLIQMKREIQFMGEKKHEEENRLAEDGQRVPG